MPKAKKHGTKIQQGYEAAIQSVRDAKGGHTPTPWTVDSETDNPQGILIFGVGKDDQPGVANVFNDEVGQDQAEANAAFIVRACNSYNYNILVISDALELLNRGQILEAKTTLTEALNQAKKGE